MFRKSLLVFAALVAALLVGCDGDVTVDNTPVLPTEPTMILLAGQCRTSGARIECEDSSRSSPADRLRSVTWGLRSSTTGISIDRQQSAPGAEISFAGLAADTYDVEQTVEADDGTSAQQVHGDLVISP